jgi:ActD protein
MKEAVRIYGLMAEFDDPATLVAATRHSYQQGYRRMDAYSPFPVEGLAQALGARRKEVPLIVLLGGLVGCFGGFFMQYYIAAIYFPLNIGGRPLNSWPAFIPVTFELTVLVAALSAVFGLLALNGLPMPYHPTFNVPRFKFASRDSFFLCIEATDAKFDRDATREYLLSLGPREVNEVED